MRHLTKDEKVRAIFLCGNPEKSYKDIAAEIARLFNDGRPPPQKAQFID